MGRSYLEQRVVIRGESDHGFDHIHVSILEAAVPESMDVNGRLSVGDQLGGDLTRDRPDAYAPTAEPCAEVEPLWGVGFAYDGEGVGSSVNAARPVLVNLQVLQVGEHGLEGDQGLIDNLPVGLRLDTHGVGEGVSTGGGAGDAPKDVLDECTPDMDPETSPDFA